MPFELRSSSQVKEAERRRHVAAAAAAASISPTKKRKHRKASLLECLPVELIEKIFLYSLDINLPRASPTLAAALSSERIYRVLILLSFWDDSPRSDDDNDDGQSRAAISRALRPADYVPLEDEERRRLQSAILRCRWCTLDRVRAQLPELMRMTVQKHWFGAGITMDDAQQGALTRFLERKEDVRTFEGTGPNGKTYVLSIDPLVSVSIHCPETGHLKTHRVLSVRTFPDKLLRSGHDDNDIAFLEMLRHACGFSSNFEDASGLDLSFSRDALQKGIHNALVANNARALTTLLKIDEYFTRRRIIARNNAAAAAPGALSSSVDDMLYYSLPAEHFRTAVHKAGHDPTFFQLLLRANAESVPPDDPDITQWAMDLESDSDPTNNTKNNSNNNHAALGRWLLDFMTRLPRDIETARTNPREAAVFYLGAANRNVLMGRRYLEEVLQIGQAGDLPSWMEEVSYDVSIYEP
ncbi:hypothetical protein T310_8499 [Rasamsonia emersonii CBS 393.64]|uniref:Uncharacterized protein n=1 Tax=Rasamsonia emersonii (strain ATCC 16479 / CBS 393.64 / IMI 116815) TaxID=1408163 RepID=A0A0F4YH84_RASE3|nr:hypothetical protein T310_8499 [Rasamsonia emersonii CBS 393.64]KKA17564.1 hypothetical protein T310_8499 [Rasamsonia emersonii CBS 393.64]